jgi:putative hydrolase of the HAD superfamily
LPYKFIYFDLDDTLLDHKSAEVAALGDVYRHFALFEPTTTDKLADTYGKVNSKQWRLYSKGKVNREQLQRNRFEKTLQLLDLDAGRYEEVGTYYMQCYRNHWQWIDGAQKAYQKVCEEYSVGILTNGFAETQRKKFQKFNLYDSADHVVISEDVGALKPDPKVFERATELAGVKPNQILYVGDSLSSDIEGGSNFGWDTAWFTMNGNHDQHKKANFVFSKFSNLINFLNL